VPAPDLETLAARVAGHDESLRAIGDTVVDLTKEVRGLSRRMDRLEGRMDRLEVRVDGIQTTVDQHTGMLTEILHILRAPDGARRAGGEGDPPSPGGDR
jgi:predicted RNase H-like nuclease (RuvC/YqgF family)